MRGYPRGFYEAAPGLCTAIVVVSELPEERETLLLRLLGAGRTLRRALEELRELPEETREWQIALPILVECRIEVSQQAARTPQEEEFLMETLDWRKPFGARRRTKGDRRGGRRGGRKT